jgi:hypothetical protein
MRPCLLIASTVLLASAPLAQTRAALTGPPLRASYDLDTRRFELTAGLPGAASAAGADAPQVCFDNSLDDDGFFDVLLYPAGAELFAWGVKSCGGSSFVDEITIGFSSMASTFVGGSLTVRIYQGSTGHGNPGVLLKTIPLRGLLSFPGPVVSPVMLTIQLGKDSFFLPDGPIGWSYENQDGLTGPILVDFSEALGAENAYDVYDPAPASEASYSGTFTLGPGGASNDPKENSFWFQIAQDDVLASASPIRAGENPDILRSRGGPIVGHTWLAVVDLTAVASSGVSLVALAAQSLPGVQTPAGLLVVDPSTFLVEVSAGVKDAHAFEFPLDPALLGTMVYAQGGYLDLAGKLRLTNGLALTVGSF